MASATLTAPVTPEDFLKMPDADRFELVNGNLVELPMSLLSSYVAGQVYLRLGIHCNPARLGWLLPEGTAYRCFPFDKTLIRKPDTSFIRADRLSAELAVVAGFVTVVPDLAVEVLSLHDTAVDLEDKIDEYIRAGVRLIWIVNPQHHTVRIHRANGTIQQLNEADELTGEDVIPGFRCQVRALFLGPAGNLLQPPPLEVKD
jgi:Uma2 family endonuclease